MDTTKKLPPENWPDAISQLSQITNQILFEARANSEKLESLHLRLDKIDERLDRIEQDATERYVDLRKRIDRVDERIDTLNEQVLDFKRRVRTVEEEWREAQALKN